MEHMRRIAFETVLRACGFGSLAIFCVMIGLSFQPARRLSGRRHADLADGGDPDAEGLRGAHKNYRRTEMWLYLPKEQRPPEAYAQRACAAVLQETYLTFARWATIGGDRHGIAGAAVLALRKVARCIGRSSPRRDVVHETLVSRPWSHDPIGNRQKRNSHLGHLRQNIARLSEARRQKSGGPLWQPQQSQ